MTLELKQTQRGFLMAQFTDLYGESCSIQESSLADESAIWLGSEKNRMHLTIEMVQALIPLLQRFIDTGRIGLEEEQKPKPDKRPEGHGWLVLDYETFGRLIGLSPGIEITLVSSDALVAAVGIGVRGPGLPPGTPPGEYAPRLTASLHQDDDGRLSIVALVPIDRFT